MVSLSVPNIITIGLIALFAVGIAKFGLKTAGMSADWV
jgi:hypothetical protein